MIMRAHTDAVHSRTFDVAVMVISALTALATCTVIFHKHPVPAIPSNVNLEFSGKIIL